MKHGKIKSNRVVKKLVEMGSEAVEFDAILMKDDILVVDDTHFMKYDTTNGLTTYLMIGVPEPDEKDVEMAVNAAKIMNKNTNMLVLIQITHKFDIKIEVRDIGVNNRVFKYNDEFKLMGYTNIPNGDGVKEFNMTNGTLREFMDLFRNNRITGMDKLIEVFEAWEKKKSQ